MRVMEGRSSTQSWSVRFKEWRRSLEATPLKQGIPLTINSLIVTA